MTPRLYLPALAALLAPRPNVLAVALFYPAYVGGLLFFAIAPALAPASALEPEPEPAALQPGRSRMALGRGALFGLLAYATYDLTNQATLRGWPWMITWIDLLWGTVLSGAVACVAALITARLTSLPWPRKILR